MPTHEKNPDLSTYEYWESASVWNGNPEEPRINVELFDWSREIGAQDNGLAVRLSLTIEQSEQFANYLTEEIELAKHVIATLTPTPAEALQERIYDALIASGNKELADDYAAQNGGQ